MTQKQQKFNTTIDASAHIFAPARWLMLLLSLAIWTSCKSQTANNSNPLAVEFREENTAEFAFANMEQKAIVGKLLGAGTAGGGRSIIFCKLAQGARRCILRIRSPQETLSTPIPLDAELAEKVWNYVIDLRPGMDAAELIAADFECDSLNPNLPPFKGDSLVCRIKYPRPTDEFIADNADGQELAMMLTGQVPFSSEVTYIKGLISCRADSAQTRQCVLTNSSATPGAPPTPVLPRSNVFYGRMAVTHREHLIMTNPALAASYRTPAMLNGMVSCIVDSRKMAQFGTRKYTCRVAVLPGAPVVAPGSSPGVATPPPPR